MYRDPKMEPTSNLQHSENSQVSKEQILLGFFSSCIITTVAFDPGTQVSLMHGCRDLFLFLYSGMKKMTAVAVHGSDL